MGKSPAITGVVPGSRADGSRGKDHPLGPAGRGGVVLPVTSGMRGQSKMKLQVKEMIADAFQQLGGVEGLVAWAQKSNENQTAFYTKLWGKLVPMRVDFGTAQDYRTLEDIRQEMESRGMLPKMLDLQPSEPADVDIREDH